MPRSTAATPDSGAKPPSMRDLLGNPEAIRTMGAAAREHANACFGTERLLDATEALLREAAAR